MINRKKAAVIALTVTMLLSASCKKSGGSSSKDKNGTAETSSNSAIVASDTYAGQSESETETTKPIEGTSDKMLGIKQFEVSSENEAFSFTRSTRIMISEESLNAETEETAKTCIELFNERLGEGEQPLQLALGDFSPTKSDIVLKIDDTMKVSPDEAVNDQAYSIEINEYATVTAKTTTGLYYGMMSLLQYTKAYEGIKYGKIVDFPDVEERCLHLDAARKFFDKEWIISLIKDISYQKMNALQLHFSENEGMRIQCDTDPAIVSEEYLTKDDVKEILKEAKRYKVEIIPSFDSPGHLKKILDVHPEYRLTDTDGYVSEKTLDITNENAVSYIRSLLSEYAELFSGCKYFNIGGDECFGWSDPSRMHFEAWNVLEEYAESKWGADASAHDAFLNYMNETAAFMEQKGFRVRAWNDGLIRTNEEEGVLELSDSIDVCYWSDSKSLGAAKVKAFIDNGNNIYNVNESYLYYVLRPERDITSARTLLSEWHPGVFPGEKPIQKFATPYSETMNGQLKGAYYCIWCDLPDTQTANQVKEGSADKIAAMALKSWNAGSDIGYTKFKTQSEAIS